MRVARKGPQSPSCLTGVKLEIYIWTAFPFCIDVLNFLKENELTDKC